MHLYPINGACHRVGPNDRHSPTARQPRKLRSTGSGQAEVRSRQPLPHQPEHQAVAASRSARGSRRAAIPGACPATDRQHLVDRALEGNCLRHEVDVVELAHEVVGVVSAALPTASAMSVAAASSRRLASSGDASASCASRSRSRGYSSPVARWSPPTAATARSRASGARRETPRRVAATRTGYWARTRSFQLSLLPNPAVPSGTSGRQGCAGSGVTVPLNSGRVAPVVRRRRRRSSARDVAVAVALAGRFPGNRMLQLQGFSRTKGCRGPGRRITGPPMWASHGRHGDSRPRHALQVWRPPSRKSRSKRKIRMDSPVVGGRSRATTARQAVRALEVRPPPVGGFAGAIGVERPTGGSSEASGWGAARRGRDGRRLPRGGCGGRRVALKVLSPELAHDERFRQRFLRESQLAAALDHRTSSRRSPPARTAACSTSRWTSRRRRSARAPASRGPARARARRRAGRTGGRGARRGARGRARPSRREARERAGRGRARRRAAYVCDFGVARHVASVGSLTGDGASSGPSTTSRPSRFAASRSTAARTSTHSGACCSSACRASGRSSARTSSPWSSPI